MQAVLDANKALLQACTKCQQDDCDGGLRKCLVGRSSCPSNGSLLRQFSDLSGAILSVPVVGLKEGTVSPIDILPAAQRRKSPEPRL